MDARSHNAIEDIFQRLNSLDSGAAWAAFIDQYSALIMNVVGQFDYEQDRANECFLFVCEKLCERQFRRLQKFNVKGKASFSNWLGTVVFNLCIDWHRAEFGRATVLPAISALPRFDQLVYQTCYEQGLSRQACYEAIRSDFPDLGIAAISAALARIHALMTPRQRWQHSVRRQRRSKIAEAYDGLPETEFLHPGPTPESKAQLEEELAALQAALDQLSVEQRLLLHLRFQEGLTYQRIAELEKLGDTHRARRRVQAALDALQLRMRKVRPA